MKTYLSAILIWSIYSLYKSIILYKEYKKIEKFNLRYIDFLPIKYACPALFTLILILCIIGVLIYNFILLTLEYLP